MTFSDPPLFLPSFLRTFSSTEIDRTDIVSNRDVADAPSWRNSSFVVCHPCCVRSFLSFPPLYFPPCRLSFSNRDSFGAAPVMGAYLSVPVRTKDSFQVWPKPNRHIRGEMFSPSLMAPIPHHDAPRPLPSPRRAKPLASPSAGPPCKYVPS